MLRRIPITLAQVKPFNTSENLLNAEYVEQTNILKKYKTA